MIHRLRLKAILISNPISITNVAMNIGFLDHIITIYDESIC